MNIIIEKELHDVLQENIVCTIEFGSGLKGESNENSDKDLLHIVKSVDWWVSLPVANQHLLQYKTENEDHIYCNAHTFVKSILDGDTTIFVEMHRYGALNGTCLEFLSEFNLTYYRTLRAYLGIGRRDIKDIKKLWKTKDFRKMNKKFKFTQQGIDLVIETLREQTDDLSDLSSTFEKNDIYKNEVIETEGMDYQTLAMYEKHFNEVIEELRSFVNIEVQADRLKKTVTTEEFVRIMEGLNKIKIHSNIMEEARESVIKHFFNSYVSGF